MGYITEYGKINENIQQKAKELCLEIEKFNTLENDEYLDEYREDLVEIYESIRKKILN